MSTHDMNDAQTLCDRILLIDKGRRLLYGSVADVQRAFSSGAVEVEGDGLPTQANGLRSVSDVVPSDGVVRFLLRDGAEAATCSASWPRSAPTCRRFEVATPTLNEIFIRAVAGDPRAELVG
jgi:ABC-2 type transport system ATP-binding protein